MTNIEELQARIICFRDARDWKQFHNPKDLAIALMLEAAEVAEHFQWRTGDQLEERIEAHRDEIADELADVLYWVLLMAHDLHIDLADACTKKMVQNERKYPVDKAKGKPNKYTELS